MRGLVVDVGGEAQAGAGPERLLHRRPRRVDVELLHQIPQKGFRKALSFPNESYVPGSFFTFLELFISSTGAGSINMRQILCSLQMDANAGIDTRVEEATLHGPIFRMQVMSRLLLMSRVLNAYVQAQVDNICRWGSGRYKLQAGTKIKAHLHVAHDPCKSGLHFGWPDTLMSPRILPPARKRSQMINFSMMRDL